MTLLSFVEDRPTPKAVYNWRVYALAAVASVASCMIGYDSAFIGTTLALPSFKSEFGFDSLSKAQSNLISANIVSLYQAGAFFGAWAGYAVGYFYGRRTGLMLFSLLFVIGAGIMLASNNSIGLAPIYGGRVIAGFAIGGASNLVPIYISELSPPAIRGRLVGLYELGWQIGGLVGFWINYGISQTLAPSNKQWLIPFAVQLIPGGLLLLGCLLFIKESPRWLFSKNRRDEATQNLLWIRKLNHDDVYIAQEIAMIDSDLKTLRIDGKNGFWKPFRAVAKSKKIQWRFFLGSMLFLWQNATGINAINYYSPTIFASIGISTTDTGFLTTGLYGVVKTVGAIVWLMYLIDRLGRRKLLLTGSIGGSICMWIIGVFVKFNPPNTSPKPIDSEGVAAVVFFYLWTVFYSPTWNGTPWVLNSEMFDMTTRPLGQASAAASNWLWNFIISRFTPQMFTAMGAGGYGVYFFFASLMICSIPFVYFLVPETKSIPLESMDRLFEIKNPIRAHKLVMLEIRATDRELNSGSAAIFTNEDKSINNTAPRIMAIYGKNEDA